MPEPTGGKANPTAVNFDGSVVVGAGNPSGVAHAMMWSNNGQTVVDLHAGPAFGPRSAAAFACPHGPTVQSQPRLPHR